MFPINRRTPTVTLHECRAMSRMNCTRACMWLRACLRACVLSCFRLLVKKSVPIVLLNADPDNCTILVHSVSLSKSATIFVRWSDCRSAPELKTKTWTLEAFYSGNIVTQISKFKNLTVLHRIISPTYTNLIIKPPSTVWILPKS